MPVVAVKVVTVIVPPVIATALAFCSAIVPTPDKVWVAFHAVAPAALKVPSAGVEWVTETVMLRTLIYIALLSKALQFRQSNSVLRYLFHRTLYNDQLQFLLIDLVKSQSHL